MMLLGAEGTIGGATTRAFALLVGEVVDHGLGAEFCAALAATSESGEPSRLDILVGFVSRNAC